jgi:hypothetical protein
MEKLYLIGTLVLSVINSKWLFRFAPIILPAMLLLLLNVTGDHLFNKVNTLKMVLLSFCLILFYVYCYFFIKRFEFRALVIAFLPILATLPGALISDFSFSYGLPYELVNQTLCVIWGYLVFSLVRQVGSHNSALFLWAFVPTIMFVCIIAWVEKLGFAPLLNFPLNPFEASSLAEPNVYTGLAGRVESTFGNINYLANFLIQLLPIVSALIILTKWQNDQANCRFVSKIILAYFSLILVTIILFFTQTRAAIAASIISMGVFFFLYYRIKQAPLRPILLFGTMCLTSTGFTLYSINEEIFFRFSDLLNIQAWLSRLVSWQAAWESIKSAPLFGYGLGSSYQLFFEFIALDSRLYSGDRSFNHVHNEILQVWQEGGVFGLFIYLAFWFIPLVLAFRYVLNSSNDRESRLVLLAIGCALLAYHLHGLFSVAPRMLSCRIVAYSLLAILYGRLVQDKLGASSDIKVSVSKHAVPVCLVVIFGGSLGYLIPYAKSQSEYTGALVSNNKEDGLVQLAKEYDDIYILDSAARNAFNNENSERLLWITEKSSRVFPSYRQMDIYQAYALHWSGEVERAIGVGLEFQSRDKYNKLTNALLLSIALEQANQALWQQQLQIALEYQACVHKLLDCGSLKVNLVSGQFALPLQIIEKSDKWTVLMDSKTISFLQRLKLQKAEDGNSSEEKLLQGIISMLGQGQFFRPQILDPTYHLISADYEKLALYLRSENKSTEELSLFLDMYKEEAAGLNDFGSSLALYQSFQQDQEARQKLNQQVINELENELNKTINLKHFMTTREVLIGLSNTLLAALL